MRVRYGLVLLGVLLWAAAGYSLDVYRSHSLIRVLGDSPAHLKQLHRMNGEGFDIVEGETPDEVRMVALPEHLARLTELGYRYEVIYMDLERFYAERLNDTPLDLMGGYHTFAEIVTELDNMHTNYPNITTAKYSIGQTAEGREMWVLKISDNPGADEDEPEVFYNSLIHAREPAAMEAVLYFMNYLLSNYGTNAEVTDIVNNRELYFLPCLNPDGYEYNRQTNPNGGGQWRKNRRNNGDGSYGVDLNRNFDAAWGIDDNGSSPFPSDLTYRGTAPFSELETQHIRDFVNSRQIVTQEDFHTYSNLVLYPWGTSYYDGDGLCADNATFQMMADSMAYWIHSVNSVWYTTGTPWQTLYNTNGGSFDWEYGDSLNHHKIFAFTTEVGGATDGFWPAQSRILPLAQENLPANMFLARIAGTLAPVPYKVGWTSACLSETTGDNDGQLEPGENGGMTVVLRNAGTQALNGLNGTLSTSDPYISVTNANVTWPTLAVYGSAPGLTNFGLSVSAACPALHTASFSLHLSNANLDTTILFSSTIGLSYLDDAVEAGTGGWTTGGTNNQWHITTRRSQSPTHSWFVGTDAGNYGDNLNCYLLSDTFYLAPGAEFSFDEWYSTETGWDFGYVEVNIGGVWSAMGDSRDGASGGWLHQTYPLAITCAGTPVQFRFRFTSDTNTNAEGWYIDNISTGCPVPSEIDVTPTTVSAWAPLGGTAGDTLHICNVGGCDMPWSVSFTQLSPLRGELPQISAVANETNVEAVEIKGDESRDGRGVEQLDNGGGPDAFGYVWKDSNEPDGPTYSWIDIASVGTQLTYTLDDQTLPVTLPWTFFFYGVGYTTMNVCGNGNAHFGTANNTYSNRPLPTSTTPNALLAVLWDDLSPQNSGAVYYYNDVANQRYIVEWSNVPHFNNTGFYTFELILYQTGRIVYQYQSVSGVVNSLSIGIEDAAGTTGLQATYNAAYVTNNLAIEFEVPPPPWLSFTGATSGSIAAGSCVNVPLSFAAGSLSMGEYLAEITILSNDANESPWTIPVTFAVGTLTTPDSLTIHFLEATNEYSLRWTAANAPYYHVYAATDPAGPFNLPVGTTTTTSLIIAAPPENAKYFVVVGSLSPTP